MQQSREVPARNAIKLQHMADKSEFAHQSELAKACCNLGVSYAILAWLDNYYLSQSLYAKKQ